MSADVVVCPRCGTNLQNSAGVAGQVVACPQCQTQLQMPALSQPAAVSQLPFPNALPPAIDHLLPARVGVDAGSALPLTEAFVQARRSKGEAGSVAGRLQKRSNPFVIVFTVVMVIVLIVVSAAAYFAQQASEARRQFERQMIGNWKLVPGQSQLERWDLAFHSDGKLQMALGTELNEGHWRVTSMLGSTGDVLIDWPDDAPQTMRVRLEGGTMQVSLDGVGNFAFQAAVP